MTADRFLAIFPVALRCVRCRLPAPQEASRPVRYPRQPRRRRPTSRKTWIAVRPSPLRPSPPRPPRTEQRSARSSSTRPGPAIGGIPPPHPHPKENTHDHQNRRAGEHHPADRPSGGHGHHRRGEQPVPPAPAPGRTRPVAPADRLHPMGPMVGSSPATKAGPCSSGSTTPTASKSGSTPTEQFTCPTESRT